MVRQRRSLEIKSVRNVDSRFDPKTMDIPVYSSTEKHPGLHLYCELWICRSIYFLGVLSSPGVLCVCAKRSLTVPGGMSITRRAVNAEIEMIERQSYVSY